VVKWNPDIGGHRRLGLLSTRMPEPPELKADIESLENWIVEIRNRRRQ
jgi:hypothetical protein